VLGLESQNKTCYNIKDPEDEYKTKMYQLERNRFYVVWTKDKPKRRMDSCGSDIISWISNDLWNQFLNSWILFFTNSLYFTSGNSLSIGNELRKCHERIKPWKQERNYYFLNSSFLSLFSWKWFLKNSGFHEITVLNLLRKWNMKSMGF